MSTGLNRRSELADFINIESFMQIFFYYFHFQEFMKMFSLLMEGTFDTCKV